MISHNPENNLNRSKTKAYGIPIGAIIVSISLFLPWVKVPLLGSVSAIDLAKFAGIIWLYLLAAIAILGTYLYYSSQGKLEKCKTPIIIIFVCIGIVFLYNVISFANLSSLEKGVFQLGMKAVSPDIGIFGFFIGLIVSFFSTLSLPSSVEIISEDKTPVSSKTYFCDNCGSKIASDDRFCPNCGTKTETS
ncbi:MAG: zinc ribbon domain-containing protein [candidate division WOR-3 bacterium]|nr:zinc ribbon domain-containing protein [candidate division WOR-3 bacterium]